MTDCHCGSGSAFEDCCAPLISGAAAETAEALMRSRYSAFVEGNIDYIEATHASDVRDDFNRSAAEDMAASVQWMGLEIHETGGGGAEDDAGTVEFAASFKKDGELQVHHEQSMFRREDGRWVYVDGNMNPKSKPVTVVKVGRNDPCTCGSGKKYKKCCGA